MQDEADSLKGACLVLGERTGAFAQAFEIAVAPELRTRFRLPVTTSLEPFLMWVEPSRLGAIPKYLVGELLRQLAIAPLAVIDGDVRMREVDYLLGAREALASGFTVVATRTPEARWTIEGCKPRFIDLYGDDAPARVERALRGLKDPRQREFTSDFRRAEIVQVTPRNLRARLGEGEADRFIITRPGGGEPLPTRLGIRCGDIASINDIGVWVNSENDRMQMARITDRSISAKIRHLGANALGLRGDETDDAIAVSLARTMGVRATLPIGSVLITEAPKGTPLRVKNKVVAVAHVAAVRPGGPGGGFVSGGRIEQCIYNALDEVERFAAERKRDPAMRATSRILFPLLGAGDGGLAPELAASQMVGRLIDYIDRRASRALLGRKNHFDAAYLLAFDERAKAAILSALKAHGCEPDPDASGLGVNA